MWLDSRAAYLVSENIHFITRETILLLTLAFFPKKSAGFRQNSTLF